ncbi:putative protein [BD1-7 clade bacterium]|uniref:Glycosyltransferase 2-like domain-containing protein n=1 Tax=BD1-7 clade bacterium TaxID=2029982 RepID=A0A5S9MU15_9GAMM|nr:putative protein [BD1-7 clade bacterium]
MVKKMQNLTVSIALTTYNGMPYLKDQLASLESQTKKPDEIVIYDDGSTDGSYELLRDFVDQSSIRVVLHRNLDNLGYNKNFAKALSIATGDIVFICDQDDTWHANKIEKVLSIFTKQPRTNLVIHDLDICDGTMNPIGEKKLERINLIGDPMDCYCTGMATAVRREFLSLCLSNYSPPVTYDNWLHKCAQLTSSKYILGVSLADYRRHANAATSKTLINSAKKVTWLDSFLHAARGSTLDYLKYEREKNTRSIEWLASNKKALHQKYHIDSDRIEKISKNISETNIIYDARINIVKSSGLKRVIKALTLYKNGGYTSFSGTKSLLKDIARL